jgi:tRNA A-37 threonylcarbamoyl transferase component Bud32
MPRSNPRALSLWHDNARLSLADNNQFATLNFSPWTLHAFLQTPKTRHWTYFSRLAFTPEEWVAAWPKLLEQITSNQFKTLHHCASGDVLEGILSIGDKQLQVVVKCPRPKNFRRRISQWILGPRARRAWIKAWELVERDIPTAWPLALAESKKQCFLIMEKVPGRVLAEIPPSEKESLAKTLFHCGRILRKLENTKLYFYDAKALNWIVRNDETPVVIDLDSIRRIRQPGGFSRLLRSLRDLHLDQMTRYLERQLAMGYNPHASRLEQDKLLGKK